MEIAASTLTMLTNGSDSNTRTSTNTTTLVTVNGTPIKLDDLDESNNPVNATTTVTLDSAPKLQKIVLEDISAEEYYKEHTEETTCKVFRFQIANDELKTMIENSILDTTTAKPYRYLTGNFIRVFEKHVEAFEKIKVPIQKRNNIVYEESARNNTVYLRINGDCKLCPKLNRVKYVFTVKAKPADTDKYVEVETKCRGVHNHNYNSSMNGGGNSSANSTPTKNSRLSLPTISSQTNGNGNSASNNERVVLLTKKRKYEDDYSILHNTSSSNNPSASSPSSNGNRLNANDKNALNQIVNQISSKIMIKLDQINLKLNQISDRLFDLERKFETIETQKTAKLAMTTIILKHDEEIEREIQAMAMGDTSGLTSTKQTGLNDDDTFKSAMEVVDHKPDINTLNSLNSLSNSSSGNTNGNQNNNNSVSSMLQANGPTLQKVVLEDIGDECFYETTEETKYRIYKFQIPNEDVKVMIENSVLDVSAHRPYRYLTGDFMRVFERYAEVHEKLKICIQKRNNIVYEESARNNTVYMRINGDCKLCPKSDRVKYVFTIKSKPRDEDKVVDVEVKCKGVHSHTSNISHLADRSGSTGPRTSSKRAKQVGILSQASSSRLARSCSNNLNNNNNNNGERLVILAKKKKIEDDFLDLSAMATSSFSTNYLTSSQNNNSNNNNNLNSNNNSSNSNTNSNNINNSSGVGSSSACGSPGSSLIDRGMLSHFVNQLAGKLMLKLDQINMKINQISDRLYNLERKFENIEATEIL